MMKEREYIKKELRILGIDDGPFNKFRDKECLVIATVFRGGHYMDGLLSTKVKVDGIDSTTKLTKIIRKTKHIGQLQCIMIDGIALAGFNVIDIQKLNKKTKLPVIVIIRRKPNFKKIERALRKANKKTWRKKLKLMEKAGKIYKLRLKNKNLYFQTAGISEKQVREIIRISATHAIMPEPIRIAHLIASGVVLGESRGRS
ncbi:MAG: DUF99 family protein [Candidatus Pacearchaeota archaeon]|nr:MAG: DUF99 family protein [Candidatus Pacearchaeota archaeon]